MTLIHPVGPFYPTTAPEPNSKLGVDERGFLQHKLLDQRSFAWLGVDRFVETLKELEPAGGVVAWGLVL